MDTANQVWNLWYTIYPGVHSHDLFTVKITIEKHPRTWIFGQKRCMLQCVVHAHIVIPPYRNKDFYGYYYYNFIISFALVCNWWLSNFPCRECWTIIAQSNNWQITVMRSISEGKPLSILDLMYQVSQKKVWCRKLPYFMNGAMYQCNILTHGTYNLYGVCKVSVQYVCQR